MRHAQRQQMEREREQRARLRAADNKASMAFHHDAVIRKYEEAYRAAHGGEPPQIEYSGGWYVLTRRGVRQWRLREVDMTSKTNVMWAAVHAREIDSDAD